MMILEKDTFSTLPPSRTWMEMPRLEPEITQLSTTTFPKSPVPSVPIFRAAEVEIRVQPEMTIFFVGPYSMFPAEAFRQMQSSAQVMWQPRIRTLVEWSGSMPSEFATIRLLRMRISEISTSSQPAGWRVQKGAFRRVTSVKEM